MDRRALLERTALGVAFGVAGCIGVSPSDDTPTPTAGTATERQPAATATERETASIATTPANLTVTDTGPRTRQTDRTMRPADPTTTVPVRKRSGNVSAAFVVTDVRGRGSPDDGTATARFEPAQNRIVVTGTIHVDGCGQLAFQSIRETGNGTVVLVVGPDEYRTPDGTPVVCEHYTGEYRITLTVDGGLPKTVEVVHRQEEDDTFTLTS